MGLETGNNGPCGRSAHHEARNGSELVGSYSRLLSYALVGHLNAMA